MTETEPSTRRLRADAARNHERLLRCARDLFVERGADVPLDEIAKRAGVGIGTLYRRFPDRRSLMRAVVLEALTRTKDTAERVLAEEPTGFAALVHYMHAVLDVRISAVIPVLLDQIDMDDAELAPAREASARAVERIIDAAHADRSLSEAITFGDVGTLLVRLSRPLPGPIPAELNNQLAHRHLDLLIAGLRPFRDSALDDVSGPALARSDLRRLRDQADG
ncbi:MAG TPA: helix-turn-helix domain-containing protein [Jatrophihabitantaceae bacterium]|nr:helix-turn-helix domain-containing protein [Jatrophihabitantaceae bacterium]